MNWNITVQEVQAKQQATLLRGNLDRNIMRSIWDLVELLKVDAVITEKSRSL